MTEWRSTAAVPALAPGEIHLWRIALSREADLVQRRALLLSSDERARMRRFHFDLHRERFAIRRGALRVLLGCYLQIDPGHVTFQYSSRGKPELEQPTQDHVLRFNLSDSSDWALLGVTLDHPIGVDIEHLRPLPDADTLARDYFSSLEHEKYRSIAPMERLAGFYNCWTRKEAWLKARGDGLSVPLDSFDVTLVPGQPPRLLGVRNAPVDPRRWSLYACTPADDYVAAIAVEREDSQLLQMTFDDSGGARPG